MSSRLSLSRLLCFRSRRSTGSPNPVAVDDDGGKQKRNYGRTNLGFGDDDFSADQDVDMEIGKELLAKIQRCYERVKLVDVGFCFGLLDPVSNILVGQAIARTTLEESSSSSEEEDSAWSPASEPPIGRSIYKRSRDGLVAFLVALFPYLTVPRAMWYLNKADLDPLVAARLIIAHRRLDRTFRFLSDATVAAVGTALRCAAAAAEHPNPRHFVLGWKLLSPSLREVSSAQLVDIMSLLRRPSPTKAHLALEQSWELASDRHRRNLKQHPEMLPTLKVLLSPTLRCMLLDTIHGYYLQALALLPKDKLRSHEYHHSLLHAGHCYGPLDPVSNIIVNTLWYAQAYPLTLEKKVEIEAIGTKALLRIAVRSLYGLITYLCTRYPAVTPGEAMLRLHLAGANLQEAAHDLTNRRCAEEEEAYAAAAKAAHHPKPLQQAQFLGRRPSNSSMLSTFSNLLKREEKRGPLLLDCFPSVVASSSKPEEETTRNINVLGPWDYSYVMQRIDNFWNEHNRAVAMVESAIDMYNKQHGVPKYELHVICGVNEYVGGPLLSPFGRGYNSSHITFLATKTTAGALPELFFAECRNKGGGVGLCCPVAMPLPGTEQVRCSYCELAGSRIVHPAKESFRGRDKEFENMLRSEGAGQVTTRIISGSRKNTSWVGFLEEDQIYGDYRCDNNIVEEKYPRFEFD